MSKYSPASALAPEHRDIRAFADLLKMKSEDSHIEKDIRQNRAFRSDAPLLTHESPDQREDAMARLIDRRTRLVFETPFLIGRRPLIVTIEPWGLWLHEKGRRLSDLPISWAQVWNRAAMIAADESRVEREKKLKKEKQFTQREM